MESTASDEIEVMSNPEFSDAEKIQAVKYIAEKIIEVDASAWHRDDLLIREQDLPEKFRTASSWKSLESGLEIFGIKLDSPYGFTYRGRPITVISQR